MTELLDRLLTALDVEVEAFAVCEVGRGWRLAFGPDGAPTVHYGLAGSGVMVLADGRRYPVARDTLLLLPPGIGHGFELPEGATREFRARSRPPSRADDGLRIRAGEGDVGFAVACGSIRASLAASASRCGGRGRSGAKPSREVAASRSRRCTVSGAREQLPVTAARPRAVGAAGYLIAAAMSAEMRSSAASALISPAIAWVMRWTMTLKITRLPP